MKRSRNLPAVAAVVVICLAVVQLGISMPNRSKTYEVEQWITTPEYRTDTARAIDAYEQLAGYYMDMTAGQLLQVGDDCRTAAAKLGLVESRLNEISNRLARIEKALGIAPDGNSVTSETGESLTIKGR